MGKLFLFVCIFILTFIYFICLQKPVYHFKYRVNALITIYFYVLFEYIVYGIFEQLSGFFQIVFEVRRLKTSITKSTDKAIN